MSAKDTYHQIVVNALVKDNWLITHDPLHIKYGGFTFLIDLGAKNLLGATKNGHKIAVEIKSFLSASSLSEFHTAIGQFINYRLVLKHTEPERILYLAVTDYIYQNFFTTEFGQLAIQENQIKLLTFDAEQEVITQWLE
jgi:hypothetical protein